MQKADPKPACRGIILTTRYATVKPSLQTPFWSLHAMPCGFLQMVPRGWWKMGLLEDLKYYRPFMN